MMRAARIQQMNFLLFLAGDIIPFCLPFLVFVWSRVPKRPRDPVARFVLMVLFLWAFLIVHRDVVLPYRISEARARGNLDYDGVGADAFILLFGWVVAIMAMIPALLVRGIIELVAELRQKRAEGGSHAEEEERPEPGTGEGV